MSNSEPKQHHYLPRHYLKGFCPDDGPEQLYVYTKGEDRVFRAGINRIGKEKAYYLPKVETDLSQYIEGPAESVLKKLRKIAPIVDEERQILALFLVILERRVPRHRVVVDGMIPSTLDEEFTKLYELINDPESDVSRAGVTKAQIADLEQRWKEELPDDVRKVLYQPLTTGSIEQQLMGMDWYFIFASGDQSYVTCDDPVFFFRDHGLLDRRAELSCPLSKDVAVLITSEPLEWGRYHYVPDVIVKEINRRTISNATSRVVSTARHEWISRIIKKRKLMLNHFVP